MRQDIEIINRLGLHARAATKLVQTAAKFSAEIDVEKDGKKVNGKSILGVMMLAAAKGSLITIHCNGSDASEAMQAITTLINDKFHEAE